MISVLLAASLASFSVDSNPNTDPTYPGPNPTCPRLEATFNDINNAGRYGRSFICKSITPKVENFELYLYCERGNNLQFKIAQFVNYNSWWLLEQQVDIPLNSVVISPDYNGCGIGSVTQK